MDRVCIQMPEDAHQFFIAFAIVQAYIYEYVHDIAKRFREPAYRFTFRMNDKYQQYEPQLKVAKDNSPTFDYTGWSEKQRSDFDCFIDFDFPRAEELASRTGKHIIEALGLLLGCTPRKWPLIPLEQSNTVCEVAIAPWDKIGAAEELHCDLNSIVSSDVGILDKIEGVIGPASVFTYLAATHKKKVVEIFPDMGTYRLYHNEGIPNYQAVIGKNLTANVVRGAWDQLTAPPFGLDFEEEYALK